jgi:FkbM family methyltransferase
MYSIFAAEALGNSGCLIAFEPEPSMRGLLEENIKLNNLTNTSVMQVALGESEGEAELFPSDSPNVGTSALIQRTDYRVKRHGTRVRIRRGDDLITSGEVSQPTVLKIDTEGAESSILAGMSETLNNPRLRLIYCEVHPLLLPSFNSSADAIEQHIAGYGFEIIERHPRGSEYHIICERPS